MKDGPNRLVFRVDDTNHSVAGFFQLSVISHQSSVFWAVGSGQWEKMTNNQ
ncbi:MAG: hypothetical protein ACLFV6_06365 [Spirulinaceae cyanobacterium]